MCYNVVTQWKQSEVGRIDLAERERSSGKEVVTVNIYRKIYEEYKDKATAERYEIKEYLNELLEQMLEKEQFIKQIAPYLSIDSYQDDRLVLKDMKERKVIDVYLKGSELQCEFHNSTDCIHTKYVWSRPELGQIAKKKFITA